jgi:hypothetical protein
MAIMSNGAAPEAQALAAEVLSNLRRAPVRRALLASAITAPLAACASYKLHNYP